MWRESFKLVECKWDWERFSKPRKKWINENYSGGEITTIYAPSRKIEKFIDKIENVNPHLLKLIKEVYIQYCVGNEFRGSGSDRGYIIGDKNFLSKLVKEAYFRWIDMAWGDWDGALEYDEEYLESLRNVQL